MYEKNVLAIAVLVPTTKTCPRFLALLPSRPKTRDDVSIPVGFNGIFLPYKDDARIIDSEIAPIGKPASEDLISPIKSIIESLTLRNFSIGTVSNPELSLFYTGLMSMARELDEMPTIVDETSQDLDWVNREAGANIGLFNEVMDDLIISYRDLA